MFLGLKSLWTSTVRASPRVQDVGGLVDQFDEGVPVPIGPSREPARVAVSLRKLAQVARPPASSSTEVGPAETTRLKERNTAETGEHSPDLAAEVIPVEVVGGIGQDLVEWHTAQVFGDEHGGLVALRRAHLDDLRYRDDAVDQPQQTRIDDGAIRVRR